MGEALVTGQPLQSHGLGLALAPAAWPPMSADELRRLLLHYPSAGEFVQVSWHSPRPLSTACLVQTTGATVFVKRLPVTVRSVAQLQQEHAFMRHLNRHGITTSHVLSTLSGNSAIHIESWVYEVHALAEGVDVYRDAMSWTPFINENDAHAAGAMLGHLHAVAANYAEPGRYLTALSCGNGLLQVLTGATSWSQQEVEQRYRTWCIHVAGIGRYLDQRDWRNDFSQHIWPWLQALTPSLTALRNLSTQWTHNDWHGSNLLWRPDHSGRASAISTVLDFGLADRSWAVLDLAIAIERNSVEWLQIESTDSIECGKSLIHVEQLHALLSGYYMQRPFSCAEGALLIALLPLSHLEFALSEVGFYHNVLCNITNADIAYETYFLGHARWFNSVAGKRLLTALDKIVHQLTV